MTAHANTTIIEENLVMIPMWVHVNCIITSGIVIIIIIVTGNVQVTINLRLKINICKLPKFNHFSNCANLAYWPTVSELESFDAYCFSLLSPQKKIPVFWGRGIYIYDIEISISRFVNLKRF